MKVILDTNMLMVPHQFGVDIFEFLKDYDIAVLSSCMDELKKLAKKRGDIGKGAKIALALVKDRHIEVIKTKDKADRAILNYASENGVSVATNDVELIKALKKHHVKIIRLRQGKYLVEE